MLDILVFTDATSAESLSGFPGFQFVGHSAGATPSDEDAARQLQHSVPTGLLASEWERHPATCSYVRAGDRMYLSRGQSTGATLGGRPGNQLTVTVMTSDPYDVLPLRPAQLYSATAWDFTRPASRELPGWETPVEIDDAFEIPALHAFIVDDPWAADALPSVLTMLERTQAQSRVRLGIRHSDQTVAMRWVALLSHFLDVERALGLEFRVFSEDPLRTNAHIVGVHPLLAPKLSAAAAGEAGINLIDLERHELTSIVPSESAVRYARWFLSGDPYEALEAVDVGRRWSRHMDDEIAAAAAECATMSSTLGQTDEAMLRASLAAITALASARETDELEAYGDQLSDVLAGCPPTGPDDLLAIDAALWAAVAAGTDDLSQSLALAALEWTAARPGLLNDWAAASRHSAHVRWQSDDARRHAAGLLATSFHSLEEESLGAAFALADSLNTGISAEMLDTPIRVLVDRCIADPGLLAALSRWVHADTILRRLNISLDARLVKGDPMALRSLVAGAWDWLAADPWAFDPENPMSRWLAARELQGADAHRRREILDLVQSALPDNAWHIMLPTTAGLAPDEVIGWIRAHSGLEPSLGIEIERILREVDRFPAWRKVAGVRVLDEIRRHEHGVAAPVRALVDSQIKILRLFKESSRERNQAVNAPLRALRKQFAGRLNDLYGDWITRAVLESKDTRAALALSEGPGQRAVIDNVRTVLTSELRAGSSMAMHAAVRLLDPALGAWNDAAKSALDTIWDDKRAAELQERLLASVHGLTTDEHKRLEKYLLAQGKGRIARGVFRGATSMFGKKSPRG